MLTWGDEKKIRKFEADREHALAQLRKTKRRGWITEEQFEEQSQQINEMFDAQIQTVRDQRTAMEREEWLQNTHQRLNVFNMVGTGVETLDREMEMKIGPTNAKKLVLKRKGASKYEL